MQRKSLLTAALAAAFIFPLAATAGSDKAKSASANGANDGGAEAMFVSMDKNNDGFISKEEATGTPHAAQFATLDKDGDGKLSREEHAAAPEHVAARSKAAPTAGSTSSSTSPSTTSSDQPSSIKKTY